MIQEIAKQLLGWRRCCGMEGIELGLQWTGFEPSAMKEVLSLSKNRGRKTHRVWGSWVGDRQVE
jgi:hypothetical protein